MIPFPDPKLCPRTPGHKLYYKARRRFCKMKNPKSRGEIFTRRPMIFQKDAPDAEIGPTRAKISICNFCPAVLYYFILNPFRRCAIVAQLDRAFGSDPEGQRFESSRSHQTKKIRIFSRWEERFGFFIIFGNGSAAAPQPPFRFRCQMRYRPSVIRYSRYSIGVRQASRMVRGRLPVA